MAVNDEYGPMGIRSGDIPSVKVPAGPVGLQGVAAASGGRSINSYINMAADPRLNSIIKKMNSPLRLGLIQQTDDWKVAASQPYPYACRFMFNPPVINVSYQVATSQLPAGQQTADQLAAQAIYPGMTGLSFDLMFDRTYEVAYGPGQNNPQDLRKIGVYHDIQALERVVGVNQLATYTGAGKAGDQTTTQLGNMLMVPVYVLFGGGSNGVGLAYVGFFTSITVQYTLFSQNMVPTRALVSLNFTQIIGRSTSDLKGGTIIDRAHAPTTTASPARTHKANPRSIVKVGKSVENS